MTAAKNPVPAPDGPSPRTPQGPDTPTAPDTVLATSGLTRTFGGLRAVDDVSVRVGAGRVVGLIGPNGAGKSTVINLITGLLAVTAGTITCRRRDITRSAAHTIAAIGVARTFQTSRLFRDMTVAENVSLAGRFSSARTPAQGRSPVRGPARRRLLRQWVDELLDRFELADLRHTPAGMLSYGHQRRLEIARAVALRPLALLLDEPVAGMNDAEAAAIGKVLADLAREGMGLLLVEHNMRFVSDVADYLHVMDHGRLIAQGLPAAVLSDSNVIEAYLGTSHAVHT